jgi:hypothetical protein
MSEPSRACQKVATEKPWMKVAANQNNEALITNINKPSVMKVIGSVSKTRIGLTKRFSSPRIIAAMKAG